MFSIPNGSLWVPHCVLATFFRLITGTALITSLPFPLILLLLRLLFPLNLLLLLLTRPLSLLLFIFLLFLSEYSMRMLVSDLVYVAFDASDV